MGKRRAKQLRFADLSKEWAGATLPSNAVVIDTRDGDIDRIVSEMLHIPQEKSMILDFWVGHVPGTPPNLTDPEQVELLRLQYMLNVRYHGRRFDWLGDSFLAKMVRLSVIERRWDITNTMIQGNE